MNSPIKAHLGENCVEVYVWGATSYIKEALRLDADVSVMAQGGFGDERTLVHNAALRPTGKLPWPLSALQPHDVQLTITYDELAKMTVDAKDIRVVYKWEKVDEVIRIFLYKLSPNSVVRIFVM